MPTAPSIPAGSTLGRSYEYGVDIFDGPATEALAAAVTDPRWRPVRRHSAFQPTPTPVLVDAASYDDFGSQNQDVAGWNNTVAFSVLINRSPSTGLYLPEIEALLARTRPEAKGDLAVIGARWYHKPETGTPNPSDAQAGLATVAVSRNNTGNDGATETVTFTLTNKGPWQTISNPFTGWGVTVPKITDITPPAAAAGSLVTITGTGFLGASAVKVGTASATYQVVGGSTIIAVMPAGSAGSVAVTVTNSAGVSEAFTYTRGA